MKECELCGMLVNELRTHLIYGHDDVTGRLATLLDEREE